MFCITSAAQVEKPFAVGCSCFKEQRLPSSSGNTNLLMDTSTRSTNTFTVAGRNQFLQVFLIFMSDRV